MTGTLRRIGALAAPPPGEAALALALGVAAVACGVGLITSAGYLISRAAEQPPILSLTVTIVAVRFFGLARPVARYVERLVSHDAALRALAQIRVRFFERIEPLAPGPASAYRSGDLLSRMVGDVEALQSLYVRGFGPPVVALVSVPPASRPSPFSRRLRRSCSAPASSREACSCPRWRRPRAQPPPTAVGPWRAGLRARRAAPRRA